VPDGLHCLGKLGSLGGVSADGSQKEAEGFLGFLTLGIIEKLLEMP
jgi:hypothetical protein